MKGFGNFVAGRPRGGKVGVRQFWAAAGVGDGCPKHTLAAPRNAENARHVDVKNIGM